MGMGVNFEMGTSTCERLKWERVSVEMGNVRQR